MSLRLALLSILTAVGVIAATVPPALVSSKKMAVAAGITADVWQKFEIASVTDGNLDSDDPSSATWTVDDASSRLTISGTGEKTLLSTVNGSSDSGHTSGLAWDLSGGEVANLKCTFASAPNASPISVSYWHRTPSGVSGVTTRIGTCQGVDYVIQTYLGDSGSGPFYRLDGATFTDTTATLNWSTWYWITCRFEKNSTCTLKVYSATGTLLDTITATANNQDIQFITIGSVGGNFPTAATMYWDDILVDHTDATYPLGP